MKNARVFLAAAMLVFRVHGHALLANTLYPRDNTRNGGTTEETRIRQMANSVVTTAMTKTKKLSKP